MRRLRRNLGSEFTKRRTVVEDGDAPAMRCNREIGCARMNLNVVHAHRRYITNPDPMRSLIERGEDSEMRSSVEQSRIHEILANNFNGIIRRQIAHGQGPGFAKI